MMMPQRSSEPAGPIVITPGQVTIGGAPLPGGGAAAIYRGFRAQRQELSNQLEELQDTRTGLVRELEQLPVGAPGRAGIEARIAGIDARITGMDKQMADADAQVAKAAAVPGAVVEAPRIVRSGPPEEIYIIGTVLAFVCLVPIVFAYTRRIWKRGSTIVTAFPKEISERLARLEQSADATALEVERIGEGQRFLTRLFTEGEAARVLGTPANAMIERKGEG